MQYLSVEQIIVLVRIVVVLIAMLVIGFAFRHWRRSAERDGQRMFEQLDLIRAELLLLAERVEAHEAARPQVTERPAPLGSAVESRIAAPVTHAAPRGYEVAARLARGGATCEELISGCGLSRHEAELLLRLHGAEAARSKKSANAPAERRARLSVVG